MLKHKKNITTRINIYVYINIHIFLFVEIGYFRAEAGKLCSWSGDIAVDVQGLCEEVAKELGYKFLEAEIAANYPKGCYQNAEMVRFNHHLTGSADRASHQICRNRHTKGMKLFHCFYFHILIRYNCHNKCYNKTFDY